MFEYLLETTGYDSEPHIQLDDYYSVIGDRIPGVRHFPRTCAVKPYPAGAELGEELARKIASGPWIPPQEVSFPEQRRGQVGAEELAKRQREVWRAKGGGLIAPLLKGVVDAGVEVRAPPPRSSWSPTTRARWSAWSSRARTRDHQTAGSAPAGASCWPAAASTTTPRWSRRSSGTRSGR